MKAAGAITCLSGRSFLSIHLIISLLVYAKNPDVTMLATTKQWNQVGRYVNKDENRVRR
jgi:hypothetical protein